MDIPTTWQKYINNVNASLKGDNVNFINIFIDKLGEPFCYTSLVEYIQFVVTHKNVTECREKHHLLPRSIFPEYIKLYENIFDMDYTDHVESHLMLVKAYPIRSFLRPLNYMLPRDTQEQLEFRRYISEAQKDAWVRFKTTQKYQEWRSKRSVFVSKWMKEGRSKEMTSKYYNEMNGRYERSLQFKKMWEDPIIRQQITNKMKEHMNTPEMKEVISKRSLNWWYNNLDDSGRNAFTEKMDNINKEENKRRDASEKIKALWQETEFIEKMKKRKTKPKGGGSEKVKLLWQDAEWRDKMLKARAEAKQLKKENI